MANLVRAYLDDYNLINVYINKSFHSGISNDFYLIKDNEIHKLNILDKKEGKLENKYSLAYDFEIEIGEEYFISVVDDYSVTLNYRHIIKTSKFNNDYYYEGNDLGSIVKNNTTTFKVWAPTACFVYCLIDNDYKKMSRKEKGVFELTINEDLKGQSYQYLVKVNGEISLVNDPYAKATLPNNKASVVCEYNKCEVDKNNFNSNDSIIYEVSVRDISEEGTFNSFDIDYIKSLGCTHIQLLPIQDFATVNEYHKEIFYNWGYDTINYQTLEGSYSSDIDNPLQVNVDFKNLVKKIHNNGMNVILDIVFNHCYNGYSSCFNKIVPYYYFRFREDIMVDGTGCGSEFDTEQLMCRKYIIDTLKYYVECFDVDGFRFDLMSFIDTETMNEIDRELTKIKEDIMLYGEGWDMITGLKPEVESKRKNRVKLPQIGFFNDDYRDTILGVYNNFNDIGYINGNYDKTNKVTDLLLLDNFQTINYVQCHDNLTCFDRIMKNENNIDVAYDKVKLANALVLLCYSMPFIGSGQEFANSKNGIENNYNSSDSINKLNCETKNYDVLEFTKKLIAFRKKTKFYTEKPNIKKNDSGIIIIETNKYKFIFNCSNDYYYYENNDRLLLYSNNDLTNVNNLKPYSMIVLEKL